MSNIVQHKIVIQNVAATSGSITLDSPVTAGNSLYLAFFAHNITNTNGIALSGTPVDNLAVAADGASTTPSVGSALTDISGNAWWTPVAGGATTYTLQFVDGTPNPLSCEYVICAFEVTNTTLPANNSLDDWNADTLQVGTAQNTSATTFPYQLASSGNNIIMGIVASEDSTSSAPFTPAAGMAKLDEVDAPSGVFRQVALVGTIDTSGVPASADYNWTTTASSVTAGQASFSIHISGVPSVGNSISTAPTSLTFSANYHGSDPASQSLDILTSPPTWTGNQPILSGAWTTTTFSLPYTRGSDVYDVGTMTRIGNEVTIIGSTDSFQVILEPSGHVQEIVGPGVYNTIVYGTPFIIPAGTTGITLTWLSGLGGHEAWISQQTPNLPFTVTTDQAWLSALPASGMAPEVISVSAALGALTPGTHTGNVILTASTFESPLSVPVSFVITSTLVASSTSCVSLVNPTKYGETATFTAIVTGSSGTPTGTVTFYDGVTVLASVSLTAVDSSTAQASFSTSTLSIGTHPITASYAGDSIYDVSVSPVFSQEVISMQWLTTLPGFALISGYSSS